MFFFNVALVFADADSTEQNTDANRFIRLVETKPDSMLQTATRSYERSDGITVFLVGAIHVAERAYYEQLNAVFKTYDVLLYELVSDVTAPSRAEVEAAGESLDFVMLFQKWMKNVLQLESQLEHIDYRAKNFVHADLTRQAFNELQKERNESLYGFMLRAALESEMKGGSRQSEMVDLMRIILSKDRRHAIKLMLARQLSMAEELVPYLEGDNGSVILTERNKVAIEVLKDEITKSNKKIGIFYGVAHLPDLENRLIDLGFAYKETQWHTAWRIVPKKKVNKGDTRGSQE